MRRRSPPDGSGSRALPAWFRGALAALVAAGVLDAAARRAWTARAREALGGAPPTPDAPAALRRRAAELVATGVPGVDSEDLVETVGELGLFDPRVGTLPHDMHPVGAYALTTYAERRVTAERLLRVVTPPPLPGPAQLVSADLYEDGVVLTWCHAPPGPDREVGDREWSELADDVGTRYVMASGGGGSCGPGTPATSSDVFAPAVPPHAELLRITRGDLSLDLPLRS